MPIEAVVIFNPIEVVEVKTGPAGPPGPAGELSNPVNHIEFDLTPAIPSSAGAGTMYWNPDDNTVDIIVNAVVLQVGQEFFVRVVNKTGSIIPNGTPVSIIGVQGNRPSVVLTDITNEAHVKGYIGLTTETIADNAQGMVTVFGQARNLNTSTFDIGDRLWVTGTGGITKTEPVSGFVILIGQVLVKSVGNGSILVIYGANEFTAEQMAAIVGAHSPSATNPFMTRFENEIELVVDSAGGLDIDLTANPNATIFYLDSDGTNFTPDVIGETNGTPITLVINLISSAGTIPTIDWCTLGLTSTEPDISAATTTIVLEIDFINGKWFAGASFVV